MTTVSDYQLTETGTITGLAYTQNLNDILEALATTSKGTEPGSSQLRQGLLWIDDTAGTTWTLKIYDGAAWVSLLAIDSSNDTIDLGKLNNVSQWNKQQYYSASSLIDGTNIAWNLDDNPSTKVTLANNRTLDNPTNMREGMTYILRVIQDATGSRTLAYGNAYDWTALGGTAPTLSTNANAEDLLVFYSDGTKMYGLNNANIKG